MTEKEIERMLRPRFEVIAPYPFSPYKVGDIIEKIAKLNWQVKQRPVSCLSEDDPYAPYPHLFREMKWWEKRTEAEMPEYVKFNNSGVCMKSVEHFFGTNKNRCKVFDGRIYFDIRYEALLPATEAEYEKGGVNENR